MDVKGLQDRLGQMGFYRGPRDGKMNKELDEALAKAQRAKKFIPAQLLEDEPKVKKGGK